MSELERKTHFEADGNKSVNYALFDVLAPADFLQERIAKLEREFGVNDQRTN